MIRKLAVLAYFGGQMPEKCHSFRKDACSSGLSSVKSRLVRPKAANSYSGRTLRRPISIWRTSKCHSKSHLCWLLQHSLLLLVHSKKKKSLLSFLRTSQQLNTKTFTSFQLGQGFSAPVEHMTNKSLVRFNFAKDLLC